MATRRTHSFTRRVGKEKKNPPSCPFCASTKLKGTQDPALPYCCQQCSKSFFRPVDL